MADVGRTDAGSSNQPKRTAPLPDPHAAAAPPPAPNPVQATTTSSPLGSGGWKMVAGGGALPQDLRIPAYDRSSSPYSGYLGVEYSKEHEGDLGNGFTGNASVNSTIMHNFKPGEPTSLLEAKTALAASVSRAVRGVTLTAGAGVDLVADASRRGVSASATPNVSAGAAFALGQVHVESRLDAPLAGFRENWAVNTTIGVPKSKYLPDLNVANGPKGVENIGISKSMKLRDGLSIDANVGVDSPFSKDRGFSAGVSVRWSFGGK